MNPANPANPGNPANPDPDPDPDPASDPLTYKIIGCAMKVHRALGGGFPEVIYQRSLAIEMQSEGIPFQREKPHQVFYNGECVGSRRADFVVDDKVIVELKAVFELEALHFVQAKNYVVAYDFPKGLLINFGGRSLQYKLIFNRKKVAGLSRIKQD